MLQHYFTKTILVLSLFATMVVSQSENINVLVFTKANVFVHESRITGAETIKEMEKTHQFNVVISEDSLIFSDEKLKDFDVIVFMNTSGNVLNNNGKQAFKKFVQNGGGFVGIHGASDTEYDWEWYDDFLGTHFDEHPKVQTAIMDVLVNDAPSTKHLPAKWEWTDEWYNWRHDLNPQIEVLITVDENTYEGGKYGLFHPISWRQEIEGGRCWYTALGHKSELYNDEHFIRHIAGGIEWASGKKN